MHLVWNLHPVGGLIGDGTSPVKVIFSFFVLFMVGTAEIRAFVYGWIEWFIIVSTGPCSTICPAYITAI